MKASFFYIMAEIFKGHDMVFNTITKLIVYFIHKNNFCFIASTFGTFFVALVIVDLINLPSLGIVQFCGSDDKKFRIEWGNVSKGKCLGCGQGGGLFVKYHKEILV